MAIFVSWYGVAIFVNSKCRIQNSKLYFELESLSFGLKNKYTSFYIC